VPEVGLEPTRRLDPRGILSPPLETQPLGKSMIYQGVFLSLVGWRGVVWGQL
jgi:hypothetical protein